MTTANHGLHLRDAREDDLPRTLLLYERSGLDPAGTIEAHQVPDLWTKLRGTPSARLRLAELGGQIVGTYTMFVLPLLAHGGAPEAVVEDVAVDPDWQGIGVGRLMMEDAMGLARLANCYKLVLSSNAKRVAAHAFYESIGFRRHGFSFHVDLEECAP